MSRSLRATVAALAFSEAAAGMMLDSGPDHPEIQESARLIKGYCEEAYHLLPKPLTGKDVSRFKSCMDKINAHFSDGARIDAQKMIGFCCFLLEEPVTTTKNRPLWSCLRSVADLLIWVAGILEAQDGADAFGPLREADDAFRIWRESGWA